MGLKLNVWRKDSYTRIYVNGLPIDGKAWLVSKRGMIDLQFAGGGQPMDRDEVMGLVAAAVGFEIRGWDELLAAVEAMPAPRRGGSAERMASSRRGASEHDRPAAWTASDAAFLDPNTWRDPLPEPTTLVIDDREPSAMVDWFRRVDNLKLEIASLETGDYLVPGKLMIERKTAADFAASVIDDSKRLFYQTDRVASSGLRGILLIEGDIYSQTNMTLNSITGTLSYLAAIQGISIIPTLCLEHTADTIVKLLRHSVHGLGYDLALRGSGPKDPAAAAAFVLEGIPGVSATMAKALLAAFGSVTGVCRASLPDLRNVTGIGPKRAALIFETLRASPR